MNQKQKMYIYGALLILTGIETASAEVLSLRSSDSVEVGFQAYSYEYEEKLNGSFFMETKGEKYGVSVAGIKTIDDYFIKADYRYATGDVTYKSASGTGDVSDNVHEMRAVFGKEVLIDNYLLGSYLGIGYRLLNNDLRDLGAGGYRRESRYTYVPIGVFHRFHVTSESRITTNIEYDYFISGEQKSYLSDVSPAHAAVFGDPVNKQKDGHGWRGSVAYELETLSLGVFVNYWEIKDSQTNYYTDGIVLYSVKEPYNETVEAGVELKYKF